MRKLANYTSSHAHNINMEKLNTRLQENSSGLYKNTKYFGFKFI